MFLFVHLIFTNHFTDLFFSEFFIGKMRIKTVYWRGPRNTSSNDDAGTKALKENRVNKKAECGHLPQRLGNTSFIKAKPLFTVLLFLPSHLVYSSRKAFYSHTTTALSEGLRNIAGTISGHGHLLTINTWIDKLNFDVLTIPLEEIKQRRQKLLDS